MAELSNKSLALLVFVSLVVIVAGTVINLNGFSVFAPLTGFATSDTGTVNLTINSTLAIQVASGFNSISFGTCNPRPGVSYSCSSNDTVVCGGNNNLGNCSGDTTTPQYLRIDNVGNVNASVNVTSECTAATLIGGASPSFAFVTTNCNGTGVSSWSELATSTQNACDNLAYAGGAFRLYANITIPQDATGGSGAGCTDAQSTLTFSAVQAP